MLKIWDNKLGNVQTAQKFYCIRKNLTFANGASNVRFIKVVGDSPGKYSNIDHDKKPM